MEPPPLLGERCEAGEAGTIEATVNADYPLLVPTPMLGQFSRRCDRSRLAALCGR